MSISLDTNFALVKLIAKKKNLLDCMLFVHAWGKMTILGIWGL